MAVALVEEVAEGALRPLRESLNRAGRPDPVRLRELIDGCLMAGAMTGPLREAYHRLMARGVEGRSFLAALKAARGPLTEAATLFRTVQGFAINDLPEEEGRAAAVAALASTTLLAEEFLAEVEGLISRLETPPPEIPTELLAEWENPAPVPAGCVSAESALARLRGGRPGGG